MDKIIPITKNPFDEKVALYKTTEIIFQEGITILVGCNGSGKTTLIREIKSYCYNNKIPYTSHDNFTDGKNTTMESALIGSNMDLLAVSAMSSEGENISISLGVFLKNLYNFLYTGKTKKSPLTEAIYECINSNDKKEEEIPNERWILLDALDSGWSIDNIIEFKETLKSILKDSNKLGVHMYIIISANSYEMTIENTCIDVYTGKKISFKDYNDYKAFILKTNERKKKRYS